MSGIRGEAMADESYQQQIAQMRMERKQAEARDRYEMLREQYEQAVEARDEESLQIMSKGGDRTDYDYWDSQVEEAERGLAPYLQAQQPKFDPRFVEWYGRNQNFIQRYGQRANAAITDAHHYMFRPRNPNTINPAHTGCGMHPSQAYTPEYFKKLEDILEMHSEMYHGIKYDPNEKSLTPNEAANISGVSPQHYNWASQQLAAQGKFNKG
jgi:hypothetical protein